MTPSQIVIVSPQHNATYPNNEPMVTKYRVIVGPVSAPTHEIEVLKANATPITGDQYSLWITALMAQLPAEAAGTIYVRAENPMEVGPYGAGIPFLKSLAPVAVDVIGIS